ncbi:MAG: UDP-forming cellulose synthase catalytic subunit [Gammaproteobacteria bacterium]|nr:UDP-forming cellulose synthase catalytic subunit [Gammaproteobacteria bacterium]
MADQTDPFSVPPRSLWQLQMDPDRARRFALTSTPFILAVAFVYLLDLGLAYFQVPRQNVLGWGAFALLVVMFKPQMFKRPPWRFLFILLAAFLALRYLIWRTTVSLVYTGFWDFVGMSALYLAEVYAMIVHFLGLSVNLWPMRNRPALLPSDRGLFPTVDVLIPTYNEADDIIRVTAIAATQLDYPKEKLRIYLCDDGGTLAKRNTSDTSEAAWQRHYRLRRMARDLGIRYLTRESNRSAKAGNINHALQHTDGDLILTLDCDHVPTRDFLSRTVEYFLADPKLFLVQTPHFFINPSPVEGSLSGTGNPSAESDMFYREIHRSLDFWNASYYCGSAAVLRRAHLDKVGGLSGSTITEDAETALKLHCAGYNSAYMDMPMVCGLAPDNYDNYVLQRTRWAQGMTQMLVLHNPLTIPGLTVMQRLCYFNSCFFWLFGFARIMFYIAPALFLLFGLKIYHVSLGLILSIAAPYVLSTFFVMDYFYGRTRQPFFSEIYESVQAIFLLPAVLAVMLNPTKPSFKVTLKGQSQQQEALNSRATIFAVVIVICVLSLFAAVVRWLDFPAQRDTILVTGVWCAYNLFLACASLGAFWERRKVRGHYRINVREPIRLSFPRLRTELEGQSTDIALTGMGFFVKLPHPPVERERVSITVPLGDGTLYTFDAQLQRIIATGGGYACGAKFLLDQDSYPQAVSHVYGHSSRWLKFWVRNSSNPGTLLMLQKLLVLGAKGAVFSLLLLAQHFGAALASAWRRVGFAIRKPAEAVA